MSTRRAFGERGLRWLFVPAVPSAGQGFAAPPWLSHPAREVHPLWVERGVLGARSAGVRPVVHVPPLLGRSRPVRRRTRCTPGIVSTGLPSTAFSFPTGSEKWGCGVGSGGQLPSLHPVGRLGWPRATAFPVLGAAGHLGSQEPGASGAGGVSGRAALGPCPWGRFCGPSPLAKGSDAAKPLSPLAAAPTAPEPRRGQCWPRASRPRGFAATRGPPDASGGEAAAHAPALGFHEQGATVSGRHVLPRHFRLVTVRGNSRSEGVTSVAHGCGTVTLSWKSARGPSLAEGMGAEGTAWPAGPPQGAGGLQPCAGTR